MSNMTSEQMLLAAFGSLVIGAVATALCARDWRRTGWLAVVFTAVAAVLLWLLAARALTEGTQTIRSLLTFKPLGASLTFRVDKLSAIFLMLVPFVGLATTLYAVEFMRKAQTGQSPRAYYPFALLMTAAIVGVVTSSDLFFFFVFWELMTLVSWVLVWFDREDQAKVQAAWQYFFVTHVAAACILIAAVTAYSTSGSFAFSEIAKAMGSIARSNPVLAHVLMALLLIGFVTKAGMFPFGGWLPAAYPAAPSPASAAFSGTMTKLGIYGVVRVAFEFFGATELTTAWGLVIAVFGASSIFVGTLTALREDDAKRILSYHIIGQIGYMLLGVGIGLFFLKSDKLLCSLALLGGLYHVVNHACYKSLLFLTAGAAEYRTGSRDLNKLGGLGGLMPLTLCAAVIASLSIAGIPPFSGFASKWLIYQSAFRGGLTVPLFLLLGMVAIFISLVTLASFMKLLGSIFFGKQPDYIAEVTGEVPVSMRVSQVALAIACVVLGVAPILPVTALYGAASDVLGSAFVPGFATMFGSTASGMTLASDGGTFGVWNPAVLIAALVVGSIIAVIMLKTAPASSRRTVSWYGGEEAEDDEVRYRAHGFVLPFKQAFQKVYPPFPRVRIESIRFLRKVLDFDGWLYNPVVKEGGRATDLISRSHSGVPQTYMLWQLVGVLAVVLALVLLIR